MDVQEIKIRVGESRTVCVVASKLFNEEFEDCFIDKGSESDNQIFKIKISKGEKYLFNACGTWMDWYISYNANGEGSGANLMLKLTERFRRCPSENWFKLIGSIDRGHFFSIGEKTEEEVVEDGIFSCFANDLPNMYWNNNGSLVLQIKRVS